MTIKSDYFYDVSGGWSDASDYAHDVLGLEDESVSVCTGLENLQYTTGPKPDYKVGAINISVYSKMSAEEYAYVRV